MAGIMLSLEGKVALITGGSRGIGAETVRLFTAAGARVAFSYRVAAEEARKLAGECGGSERCVAIQQELSTPKEGRTLISKTVDAFGRLDSLVVNHGVWAAESAPIGRMTEAQWSRTMGVNLDSVFGLVQAAVAQMQRQGRSQITGDSEAGSAAGHGVGGHASAAGHIVLISSTAGQRGEAFHADYAVTKGALISLTKSLSSELAWDGIYVNCVAPGWVATDMSAPALEDPATKESIFRGIPLGRVATPLEVAGPVLFLCTHLAGFISGEVLNINGGAVLVG